MKVGRAKFGGYTLFTTDGYRRLHKYWSINTLAIYRNQTEASHGRIYSDQTVHYGLTGGWVQKFKGSYLLCFLHSVLVFKARGQCDHHAFPLA